MAACSPYDGSLLRLTSTVNLGVTTSARFTKRPFFTIYEFPCYVNLAMFAMFIVITVLSGYVFALSVPLLDSFK